MDLRPASRGELLRIAKQALRAAVTGREHLFDPPTDPELTHPAGCFVSLHELETHKLRGCIGRLEATAPLWRIVTETAVNVLGDPRFDDLRVTPGDLPNLQIELSVLSPLTPCGSPLDFDLHSDGIYLILGERAGCFLPQVARETGWTKEQLLDRLCTEKLGMSAELWRTESATLMRFSTVIVGPEPVE
jgi:AmmeMemoRadiSam system protein A